MTTVIILFVDCVCVYVRLHSNLVEQYRHPHPHMFICWLTLSYDVSWYQIFIVILHYCSKPHFSNNVSPFFLNLSRFFFPVVSVPEIFIHPLSKHSSLKSTSGHLLYSYVYFWSKKSPFFPSLYLFVFLKQSLLKLDLVTFNIYNSRTTLLKTVVPLIITTQTGISREKKPDRKTLLRISALNDLYFHPQQTEHFSVLNRFIQNLPTQNHLHYT